MLAAVAGEFILREVQLAALAAAVWVVLTIQADKPLEQLIRVQAVALLLAMTQIGAEPLAVQE